MGQEPPGIGGTGLAFGPPALNTGVGGGGVGVGLGIGVGDEGENRENYADLPDPANGGGELAGQAIRSLDRGAFP